MNAWENFPATYRATDVHAILPALRSGACVALLGLSGSGKSNLLGFLAHRRSTDEHPLLLVDANRLLQETPQALLDLTHRTLGPTRAGDAGQPLPPSSPAALDTLDRAIAARLQTCRTLALLFDRFDIFATTQHLALHNTLRALRDAHKYRLTYVFATRRPLPLQSELAELLQGNIHWLGPLATQDARWNVTRFARRHGQTWDEETVGAVLQLSRGYPSLLKAACEAVAANTSTDQLASHPAVQARLTEFWRDEPTPEQLQASGLAHHPLLLGHRGPSVAPGDLTAHEKRLYDYLQSHPDRVCEKDELIRAVWPEDAVYEEGIRDSSLAQLVRRLRLKVEQDASDPRFIKTVPGRGYLFQP